MSAPWRSRGANGFWAREEDDEDGGGGTRKGRRPLGRSVVRSVGRCAVEADRLLPPNRRSQLPSPREMRPRERGRGGRKGE